MANTSETWSREQFAEYQRTGKTPGAATTAAPPAEPVPDKLEIKEERGIHTLICQELKRRGVPYIHAPMNKRPQLPEGWPDFTVFQPKGKVWFAEIKTATGRLSKEQRERKEELEGQGFSVYVPRSFDEFMAIFKDRELWQQEGIKL